jgi:hypothetical protein
LPSILAHFICQNQVKSYIASKNSQPLAFSNALFVEEVAYKPGIKAKGVYDER